MQSVIYFMSIAVLIFQPRLLNYVHVVCACVVVFVVLSGQNEGVLQGSKLFPIQHINSDIGATKEVFMIGLYCYVSQIGTNLLTKYCVALVFQLGGYLLLGN